MEEVCYSECHWLECVNVGKSVFFSWQECVLLSARMCLFGWNECC